MFKYEHKTFSPTNWTDVIGLSTSPELAVSSKTFLARAELRKLETFIALSHVTDGDSLLRNILSKAETRAELRKVVASAKGLNKFIQLMFGQTGIVEANTPRYTSMTVLDAINSVSEYSDYSLDTRLFLTACLSDMLDVFKMRQEASVTSWVKTNSGEPSPSMDDIINELMEASLSDKISHELQQFRKKVDVPKKRFSIYAFSTLMSTALRNIAEALSQSEYRELALRDTFQLLARRVLDDDKQVSVYGNLRANEALHALTVNSTIVRLALEAYDKAYICQIPASDLKTEAESIARNLNGLKNFDVLHSAEQFIQLSAHYRSQTGALSSAVISGVKRSVADAQVYTIIDHDRDDSDFLDATNKTKQFAARIPKAPDALFNGLVNSVIVAEEESAFSDQGKRLNRLNVAVANVSETLLHDVVATMCDVTYEYENGRATPLYNFTDVDGRLKSVSPSEFSIMSIKDASVAFAALADPVESVTSYPLFKSEALILDGKFSGAWPNRNTADMRNITITINDILNEDSDDSVGSVVVDLFGSNSTIPQFTEISTTEGWANLINMLNAMGVALNGSGSQRNKIQRSMWATSILTQLANWVNRDVALHSLVNRAVYKFSEAAQKAELPEEFYRDNSYYYGMISLQCVLSTLVAMAKIYDSTVELDETVSKMLTTPEALQSFSQAVNPA